MLSAPERGYEPALWPLRAPDLCQVRRDRPGGGPLPRMRPAKPLLAPGGGTAGHSTRGLLTPRKPLVSLGPPFAPRSGLLVVSFLRKIRVAPLRAAGRKRPPRAARIAFQIALLQNGKA
jgi:hypothetical protein